MEKCLAPQNGSKQMDTVQCRDLKPFSCELFQDPLWRCVHFNFSESHMHFWDMTVDQM